MKPWMKTALSYAISIPTTTVATIAWMNQHAVDIYALWDKIGQAYALIVQIIATAVPLVLSLWAIWRTLPFNRLVEIANDPASVKAATQIPPTPNVTALADALKKNGQ